MFAKVDNSLINGFNPGPFIPSSFDIKILYFDFYLPKFNTCIEYDGEQHFKPVDFAGKGEKWAEQQFAQIQIRDNIKNVYCIDNSIQLLRIKYTENIETVLDDFFNFENNSPYLGSKDYASCP